MSNRNKALGTSFETDIKNYLWGEGFTRAYRPATKGALDTGDINGITRGDPDNSVWFRHAIIQCKRQKAFDLSGWLNDAVEQAHQDEVGGDALPIVVAKRPRMGTANIGKSYAILQLEDLVQLLREAGYR